MRAKDFAPEVKQPLVLLPGNGITAASKKRHLPLPHIAALFQAHNDPIIAHQAAIPPRRIPATNRTAIATRIAQDFHQRIHGIGHADSVAIHE